MRSRAQNLFWLAVLITATILLALSACQPAVQGTPPAAAPTAGQDYPAGSLPEAPLTPPGDYPPPGEESAAAAYPIPAASDPTVVVPEIDPAFPMAGPVIENASRISARLLEITPQTDLPRLSQLRVLVLAAEEVAGMPSFTRELTNQEVDLYAITDDLSNLAIGETFEAEVEYRGDEHGGNYFIRNLIKINP